MRVPTQKQLETIRYIEQNTGLTFVGTTFLDADSFISKNISLSKSRKGRNGYSYRQSKYSKAVNSSYYGAIFSDGKGNCMDDYY